MTIQLKLTIPTTLTLAYQVVRQELCETDTNKAALRVIDSALFVLVLDDFKPPDIHGAAANMLHGANELKDVDTMQVGSCLNRWYDKLQLIVCSDGTSGLIFEHSIIDGHTALRFVSDIFAETVITFAESIVDLIHGRGRVAHVVDAIVERAAVAQKEGLTLDVFPKKLIFDLSDSIMKQIYFAETNLCDEILASDTFVLEYHDYGKRLIVANNLSPDAFLQMSILLAYYRLYGRVDCMYEPALTKTFFHGRTEAIRGTTPQAKELCQIWCDDHSTPEQKLEALRRATIEHSRLTKEAVAGMGVDRHLFALKSVAARKGMPTSSFFKSEAWRALNHTILSTSNCGNPALRLFGFGPVVPDGFGIGYIIKDNALSVSVCSKHRQTQRYVLSLRRSLNEMQELLKPISTVAVDQQRPTLGQVKKSLSRKNSSFLSYGDMWGESKAVEEMKNSLQNHSAMTRQKSLSQYFSRMRERSISMDMLGVETIDVPVEDANEDDASC
jgi:carnitine O-acetyltransferase